MYPSWSRRDAGRLQFDLRENCTAARRPGGPPTTRMQTWRVTSSRSSASWTTRPSSWCRRSPSRSATIAAVDAPDLVRAVVLVGPFATALKIDFGALLRDRRYYRRGDDRLLTGVSSAFRSVRLGKKYLDPAYPGVEPAGRQAYPERAGAHPAHGRRGEKMSAADCRLSIPTRSCPPPGPALVVMGQKDHRAGQSRGLRPTASSPRDHQQERRRRSRRETTTPRAVPWPGRRGRCRRSWRNTRARLRPGLTPEIVVDLAPAIVDEHSRPPSRWPAVAARAGVATTSLYKHVRNLAEGCPSWCRSG